MRGLTRRSDGDNGLFLTHYIRCVVILARFCQNCLGSRKTPRSITSEPRRVRQIPFGKMLSQVLGANAPKLMSQEFPL